MNKKNMDGNINGCRGKKDGSGKGRDNENKRKDNCGNRRRDGSCGR